MDDWELLDQIGAGGFGDIYLCRTEKGKLEYRNKIFVAKRESKNVKKPHLQHEFEILLHLIEHPRILKCHHMYQNIGEYNYLIMDLKGPNLSDLFELCDHHFTGITLARIGIQIIDILQFVHMRGIIHRDMKPDNIVVGAWPHDCDKIYLLDFGLSKAFITSVDGVLEHIPQKYPKCKPRSSLTGTLTFASLNAHYGDQSRRDDLYSFAHVLVYWLRGGELPWNGINSSNKKERYARVYALKTSISVKNLCRGYSREFRRYFEYANHLEFTEKPNYEFCIENFKGLLERKKFQEGTKFCWEHPAYLGECWPETLNQYI